jgi:hypothetical protein
MFGSDFSLDVMVGAGGAGCVSISMPLNFGESE